jgi:hypothetical protein
MRHNSDASRLALHGSPGVVLRDDILFECLIVFDVFQSDNDGFGGQSVSNCVTKRHDGDTPFLIKVRSMPTIKIGSRSTARRTIVPIGLNFGLRMTECIAQCLKIRHAASKLCILGFEPLE